MLILYPEIKAYSQQMIEVSDGHEIYVEESGNPRGIPVLFVHGGPGGGCSAHDRRYFDPEAYRIILFDQRGSGRSLPHASIEDNNTQKLISDLEVIRLHFGIDSWVLFGGSWGSTLSLLYAQRFPERVKGLVLRGIFLCRQQDIEWFYQSGASKIFPDYWEDYLSHIPETERDDMVAAYYRLLTGDNELAKMSCAKAWSIWEARCSTLRPNPDVVHDFADPHKALSLARIEAHYFYHRAFIDENQILRNVRKLEGIPGIIIHGRYDMVCPVDNAVALHHLWHDSELHIIRDAGHSSREPGIVDGLIRATRSMARRFGDQGPVWA